MSCQICFENFDKLITLNKVNKNCGHSFCQSCLITYFNHTNKHFNIICPICRTNHLIIKWHDTVTKTQMCKMIIWMANISIVLVSMGVVWNFKLMIDMIGNQGKRGLYVFGLYNIIKVFDIMRQINSKLCTTELFRNIIINFLHIAIIVLGNLTWNINELYNLFNLIMISELIPFLVFEIFRYVIEIDKINFHKPVCIYYRIGNTTVKN